MLARPSFPLGHHLVFFGLPLLGWGLHLLVNDGMRGEVQDEKLCHVEFLQETAPVKMVSALEVNDRSYPRLLILGRELFLRRSWPYVR